MSFSFDDQEIFTSTETITDSLTPIEAQLAIGLMAMAIDANFANEEIADLEDFLDQSGLDDDARQEARQKVQMLFHEVSLGALFNSAKQSLDSVQREAAFTLAVKVALADANVCEAEMAFLRQLAHALEITAEQFRAIVASFASDD